MPLLPQPPSPNDYNKAIKGYSLGFALRPPTMRGILFMQIFNSLSIPCDSCGNECANACGTKHFRTCCFNYLRKRSDPELFTNKRLIDVMMLQGRAMYTENELSNNRRHAYLQQPRMFDVGPRHNGTNSSVVIAEVLAIYHIRLNESTSFRNNVYEVFFHCHIYAADSLISPTIGLQTEFALANIEPQIVLNGDKCIDSNMPAQLMIPYGVQARNHNDIVTKATLANLISTDLPLSASLLRREATFIFLA
uniref:Trissin n=1 Tax=Glossina pallidipes TaxID=7398 RepID=A0A1A9ZHN8_GLOPL